MTSRTELEAAAGVSIETSDYVLQIVQVKSDLDPSGLRSYYGAVNKATGVVEGMSSDLPGGLSGLYGMQDALDGVRATIKAATGGAPLNLPAGGPGTRAN